MNNPAPETARLTSPQTPPAPPPAVDVVSVTLPDIQESWSGTPTTRSPASSRISSTGRDTAQNLRLHEPAPSTPELDRSLGKPP